MTFGSNQLQGGRGVGVEYEVPDKPCELQPPVLGPICMADLMPCVGQDALLFSRGLEAK